MKPSQLALIFTGLLLIAEAWSEPTAAPVGQKLSSLLGQSAAVTTAPQAAGLSPSGAALPAVSQATTPAATPLAPPPPTPEQRREQMLLSNAERIDNTNRGLLADKQKLLIQLEQLQTQVNVLKNDRSNEGIREGALAVIAGFLLGWFFASSRRKSW